MRLVLRYNGDEKSVYYLIILWEDIGTVIVLIVDVFTY